MSIIDTQTGGVVGGTDGGTEGWSIKGLRALPPFGRCENIYVYTYKHMHVHVTGRQGRCMLVLSSVLFMIFLGGRTSTRKYANRHFWMGGRVGGRAGVLGVQNIMVSCTPCSNVFVDQISVACACLHVGSRSALFFRVGA